MPSALTHPFDDIRQELDRFFQELERPYSPLGYSGNGMERLGSSHRRGTGTMQRTLPQDNNSYWAPSIELCEAEKEYILKAEIPGIRPENIQVEVIENQVILQGESEERAEQKTENVYRSELRYGRFYRAIPLPERVQEENCQATFKNGLLELHLPKKEDMQKKRIKVPVQHSSL